MTRARWLLFVLLVWCTACAASLHFDIARPQPAAPSSVAYVAASASPPAPAPSAAPASHHRLGMNVPIPAPTATAGVALVSRGAGLNPAWSALNLAASGAVTGTLPSANLPNLAGDVTGAPGANTVVSITGSGGSTALKSSVTPSSDNTYSLGSANARLSSMTGAALNADNTGDTVPSSSLVPGALLFSTGGAAADTRLIRNGPGVLTVDNGVGAGAATIDVGGSSASSPIQIGSDSVSILGTGAANGTAASLTLSGQAPNATNGTPGGVTIDLAAPTGSGSRAQFAVGEGGTKYVAAGYNPGGGTWGMLWLGQATATAPSGTNYAFASDGSSQTNFNVPASGTLSFNVGNTPFFTVSTSTIAPGSNGGTNIGTSGSRFYELWTSHITDDGANGVQLFGATSFGGGTGVLGLANSSVAPTSWPGSASGLVLYSTSGALGVDAGGLVFPSFIANPTIQPLTPTTDAATSDLTIVGQGALGPTNVNGGNVVLGGGPAASGGTPGSIKFNLGSTTYAYFGGWSANPGFYPETGGTGYLGSATNEWHAVHSDYAFVTTEVIPQTDLGAALGLSGNRWSELDVQGVSITSAGLGGNASAATPAAAALTWQTTSLALSSGTVTLTAAQASTPLIALTGSTSAAETLVFPNTQAQWYIDTTGITSLGSGAVTIECGTGAKTMSLSGSYTVGLYEVYCNGANKLYMQWIAD